MAPCRWVLVSLLVCLGPLVELRADTLITLGSSGVGGLGAAGEVDGWAFAAVKGSQVTLSVKGSGGLLPTLELAPAGSPVALDTSGSMAGEGSSSVKISSQVLGETGYYVLRIGGADGTTGAYVIKTKVKIPAAAKGGQQPVDGLEPDGTVVVRFEAQPGTRLDATLLAGAGASSAPVIVNLLGPTSFVITAPFTKTMGKKTTLKGVVLAEVGTYSLKVDNGEATTDLTAKLKLKPPKKAKGKVLEGEAPLVETAVGSYLDAVAAGGGDLAALMTSFAQVFAVNENPSQAVAAIQAAILASVHSESDMQALLASSSGTGLLVTIPPPTSQVPGDGSLEQCGAPTTVFYINGVLTPKPTACSTAMSLAWSLSILDPAFTSEVKVRLFYNPSGLSAGTLDSVCNVGLPIEAALSLGGAFTQFLTDALAKAAELFATLCKSLLGSTAVDALVDFLGEGEALSQWLNQVLAKPADSALVAEFRDVIRQELDSGRNVVIVAHSQGNFYAQEALSQLTSEERQAVGVVAIATPANYPQQASYGYFDQFTLVGDIILAVPGAPAATIANELSTASICPNLIPPVPLLAPICFMQAVTIHAIDESYLASSLSRIPILAALVGAIESVDNPGQQVGQGFLQVTLTWNTPGDIDLYVFEPTGAQVWYGEQQGDVGEIDVDDIAGTGPENYFVCKQQDLLPGTYAVSVNNYNGATGTSCTVKVIGGDSFETFHVTVGSANQGDILIPVASVTYSADGSFSIN